jgi:hypothetical protein
VAVDIALVATRPALRELLGELLEQPQVGAAVGAVARGRPVEPADQHAHSYRKVTTPHRCGPAALRAQHNVVSPDGSEHFPTVYAMTSPLSVSETISPFVKMREWRRSAVWQLGNLDEAEAMASPDPARSTGKRHPIFARVFARITPGHGRPRRRRAPPRPPRWPGRPVLEVGAGNTLNFAHYPPSVTEVVAMEPEPFLRGLAQVAAGQAPVPVHSAGRMAWSQPGGGQGWSLGERRASWLD